MIDVIKYIVLGIVQGVAEILPISSSGHLAILSNIFKIEDNGVAFEIFLHLASIIAVIFFLRKRLWQLIKGFFLYIFKSKKEYKYEFNYCLMIVIATIPAAIVALLLGNLIDKASQTLWVVGLLLMINGISLFLFSLIKPTRMNEQINYKDALVIGLFQCAGIFPGISRSGSCLSGSMVRKMNKANVADFVFIMLIPAVLGSLVLKFKDISEFALTGNTIYLYLISFIVTLLVTYYSLKLLLIVIRKCKFVYFSIYCEIIGLATLIYGLVTK